MSVTIVLALLFIYVVLEIIDHITGVIKHICLNTYKSSNQRKGAMIKGSEVLLASAYCLTYIVGNKFAPDYVVQYFSILPSAYVGKLLLAEMGSITENIKEMKRKGDIENE